MGDAEALRAQVELAAARALGDQDASPHSPSAGCFDRRYWAWKIADFPEATFQRLVLPLALLYRDPRSRYAGQPEVRAAVRLGLACAARLQHRNGSFDQAFPFEQSYGATAFLLYPIVEASRLLGDELPPAEQERAARAARRAAEFLCAHAERHGTIANHLAGAALALAAAADRFGEPRYDAAASRLVESLVARQSPEGWFPEYGGADPGYQTLCVDYLSAVAERRPSPDLRAALARAVAFLQWFVHPDGSFGGVYGSRRTSLVYLGGLARLAAELPVAAGMCRVLGGAMARGALAGPAVMDAGNLAPMLTSTLHALPHLERLDNGGAVLPCEAGAVRADFPDAGLHVRGTPRYYAVCGVSNGGTLAVFGRHPARLVLDDGGYVGELAGGRRVTSQVTDRARRAAIDEATIEVAVGFARLPADVPTPGRFLLLRVLNLTLMRTIAAGNWLKRRLARRLMGAGRAVPLRLVRRVTFGETEVLVHDRVENPRRLALQALAFGTPFSGIHMASAGYFHPARLGTAPPIRLVDVRRLAAEPAVEITTVVAVPEGE